MDKRAWLTYTAAVFIPLAQAVVIGLLAGAVAAAALYLLSVSMARVIAALVAALTASLSWLSSVRWWREQLSAGIEPEPVYLEPLHQAEPQTVSITLVDDGGRAGQYLELPVSPSKLQALASGLVSGRSFTESAWCGSGGIFTRAEFIRLRDEMYKRGLLELNSPSTPARGYHLTRGGLACVRYLSTTPLLELGGTGSYTAAE